MAGFWNSIKPMAVAIGLIILLAFILMAVGVTSVGTWIGLFVLVLFGSLAASYLAPNGITWPVMATMILYILAASLLIKFLMPETAEVLKQRSKEADQRINDVLEPTTDGIRKTAAEMRQRNKAFNEEVFYQQMVELNLKRDRGELVGDAYYAEAAKLITAGVNDQKANKKTFSVYDTEDSYWEVSPEFEKHWNQAKIWFHAHWVGLFLTILFFAIIIALLRFGAGLAGVPWGQVLAAVAVALLVWFFVWPGLQYLRWSSRTENVQDTRSTVIPPASVVTKTTTPRTTKAVSEDVPFDRPSWKKISTIQLSGIPTEDFLLTNTVLRDGETVKFEFHGFRELWIQTDKADDPKLVQDGDTLLIMHGGLLAVKPVSVKDGASPSVIIRKREG
jgi:hypothetical protein